MTPQQIMDRARELYTNAKGLSSLSGARSAAQTAASLLFYSAKLTAQLIRAVEQLQPEAREKVRMSLAEIDDAELEIPEWQDKKDEGHSMTFGAEAEAREGALEQGDPVEGAGGQAHIGEFRRRPPR